MSDERLAQIRARLAAATPGPWHDTDQDDGVLRVVFGPLHPDGTIYAERTNVAGGYALAAYFPGSMENYEGEDLHNAAFLAHSRADVEYLLAALDAATARLDHYRGTCQRCGRDGVLLDFIAEYDGMESICLEDREECDRLHEEQATRANEAFRARVAAGDPLAVMTDNFNRSMLEMSRRLPRPMLDDFKPGGIVQFVTSNFAPTTEDADRKED